MIAKSSSHTLAPHLVKDVSDYEGIRIVNEWIYFYPLLSLNTDIEYIFFLRLAKASFEEKISLFLCIFIACSKSNFRRFTASF